MAKNKLTHLNDHLFVAMDTHMILQRLWDQHSEMITRLIPLVMDGRIPAAARETISDAIQATPESQRILAAVRELGVAPAGE